MAKIAPFGRYRAFDADGNPLSGGKLYTYVAGTSTPKVTYTDNTQNSANTNPVELDMDGYADVWLDVGGYKFVLTDANDVELWTVDNIDGGSSAGYANGVISRSSGFSLTVNEQNLAIVCTAPLTVSLLPAAAAGNGFVAVIINASAGNVTIDPNGSETIDGATTLLVPSKSSVTIVCDSTQWWSFGYTRGILDSDLAVISAGDATKKVAFDVSAVTASTTRTLTVQDVSGTVYVTGGQDVAVADGGTGASTASGARTNLVVTGSSVISGLVMTNNGANPNTQIDVSFNSCLLTDSSNDFVVHTNGSFTINASTTGANGRDAGSFSANTWYYVYVISNRTTSAGLISTSSTAPTMPSGYTYKKLVGAFLTNASTQFYRLKTVGNLTQYLNTSGATPNPLLTMVSGISGSVTTPTYNSFSVSSFVPTSIASTIIGVASAGSQGAVILVAPNSSYGSSTGLGNLAPLVVGENTAGGISAWENEMFEFVLESSSLYWASNGSSARIQVFGWRTNI